jgi:hypothetical protein
MVTRKRRRGDASPAATGGTGAARAASARIHFTTRERTMKKKVTLSLDTLSVESFATDVSDGDARGTVRGYITLAGQNTCGGQATCDTCGATCNLTCGLSCPDTCPRPCHV